MPSTPAGRFVASITVPSRRDSIQLAAAFLVQTARSLNVPAARDPGFEAALHDALNQILERRPQDTDTFMLCEIELAGRSASIRIFDLDRRHLGVANEAELLTYLLFDDPEDVGVIP